ncbi:hypothetical protein [Streptomyces sp. NEAU-174]|uniref:hypothetical protein n=1 Tax=Streptomyces sp. NEAU-174 TaxID=3458254 RepID=UPI004043D880
MVRGGLVLAGAAAPGVRGLPLRQFVRAAGAEAAVAVLLDLDQVDRCATDDGGFGVDDGAGLSALVAGGLDGVGDGDVGCAVAAAKISAARAAV